MNTTRPLFSTLGILLSSWHARFVQKWDRSKWRAHRNLSVYAANPFALLAVLGRPRVLLYVALLLVLTAGKALAFFPLGGFIRHLNRVEEQVAYSFVAADVGNRAYVDLPVGGPALRYVQIHVSATVDIAAANATSVRNVGRCEALFDEIGMTGGGEGDTIFGDPRGMAFSSQFMLQPGLSSDTRLTSVAIGTYNIESMFRFWFENPQALEPKETLYLSHDPELKQRLFFKLASRATGAGASTPGAGKLLDAPAGSTVTITNRLVRVEVLSDQTEDPAAPTSIFRPKVEQVIYPVAGAVARMPFDITMSDNQVLRGLTILQVDANDNLAQLASEISFKDSLNEFLGRGAQLEISSFAISNAFQSGAQLTSVYSYKILHVNLQTRGRLSSCYNPAQGGNLQVFLTTTGAGNIIIIKHLLERDEFEKKIGDKVVRRVTTANPPANLFGVAA